MGDRDETPLDISYISSHQFQKTLLAHRALLSARLSPTCLEFSKLDINKMATLDSKTPIETTVVAASLDDSKTGSHSKFDSPSQVPRDATQRQAWYQWFSPTDTPEERRLILKLDGLIVVFLFLAHWAKVLDTSATSTAYVSGMRESLNMYGNELNYMNTAYM